MSDTSLNKIIQYGTNAARIAFTPAPAASSKVLYIWFVTDSEPDTYVWDGSAWVKIVGSTAASNQVIASNATLVAGTSTIVPVFMEIGAGISYEIGSGSILEIMSSTREKCGKIVISPENVLAIGSQPLNLVTEGTIDWFYPLVTTNPVDAAPVHAKGIGGWIMKSFRWLLNGGATLSTFSSGLLSSAAASDDTSNGSTLSSNTTGVLITQNANGYGYAFRVPADRAQRVLRLYAGVFETDAVLTVSLRSGAVPTKTYTCTNSASTTTGRAECYKIAYFGEPGDELLVSYIAANKATTTPNINVIAITLGSL
jgi:hypothetical protein